MIFFKQTWKIIGTLVLFSLITSPLTAQTEVGEASYYEAKFQDRPTASGEAYDKNKFTCAHRTLPFGTRVKVTRPDNGKSVVVRVNDRGPHVAGKTRLAIGRRV